MSSLALVRYFEGMKD